jgi:hypothetical protein
MFPASLYPFWAGVSAIGVGHEPQALAFMRGFDARSAQIGRPNGVTRTFQVRANKIQPHESFFIRNLLAKDNWRAALLDEVKPEGPEVPLVSKPAAFACRGERLARTASRPNRAINRETCEA